MWETSVQFIVPAPDYKSVSLHYSNAHSKSQSFILNQIGEFHRDSKICYLLKNEMLPIFTLTPVHDRPEKTDEARGSGLVAKVMAIMRDGAVDNKFHVIKLENSVAKPNANGIFTFQNVSLKDFKFTKKKQILQLLMVVHHERNPFTIINAFVSKEFMLHSRKVKDVTTKYKSTLSIFNPEELEMEYTKKVNLKSKNLKDENSLIEDNINGLYNYITAPNIRNKIRNPLFLAMKFKSTVKVFISHLEISDFSSSNIVKYLCKNINELESNNLKFSKKIFVMLNEKSGENLMTSEALKKNFYYKILMKPPKKLNTTMMGVVINDSLLKAYSNYYQRNHEGIDNFSGNIETEYIPNFFQQESGEPQKHRKLENIEIHNNSLFTDNSEKGVNNSHNLSSNLFPTIQQFNPMSFNYCNSPMFSNQLISQQFHIAHAFANGLIMSQMMMAASQNNDNTNQ